MQALAAVPRVVESGGGFATCAPGGESAVAGLAVSTVRWLSVRSRMRERTEHSGERARAFCACTDKWRGRGATGRLRCQQHGYNRGWYSCAAGARRKRRPRWSFGVMVAVHAFIRAKQCKTFRASLACADIRARGVDDRATARRTCSQHASSDRTLRVVPHVHLWPLCCLRLYTAALMRRPVRAQWAQGINTRSECGCVPAQAYCRVA